MTFRRPVGPVRVAPGAGWEENSDGQLTGRSAYAGERGGILLAPDNRRVEVAGDLYAVDVAVQGDVGVGGGLTVQEDASIHGPLSVTTTVAAQHVSSVSSHVAGAVTGGSLYAGPATEARYRVWPSAGGRVSTTTTSTGLVTVSHGLGVLCTFTCLPVWPTAPWFGESLSITIEADSSTTVTFKFAYGASPHASQSIRFDWTARPR